MSTVCLRGITWNHSRALPPLVAASQRYEELHPNIRITWEKRSLDEFGHEGLAKLSRSYDLLIIDHPMLGEASRDGTLLDLRSRLSSSSLDELEADALGPCLESYRYANSLYALPIDAAAPAASFRADLLDRHAIQPPSTWNDLLAVARHNLVRMPGFPADLFLNLMGMCISRGSFLAHDGLLFDHDIAIHCLEDLAELASFMPDAIYAMNPISLYEAMASGDEFAYCPFAYTYSNYSRPGFAAHTLTFANSVSLADGAPLRTVLGGTGIAISAQCTREAEAIEFCRFVAGRDFQTHLYGICGGQPASKAAWQNPLLNRVSNHFFEQTRASIEAAYIRPRYSGYIALQRCAGIPIIAFLQGTLAVTHALEQINSLYRSSLAAPQCDLERAK